MIDSTTIDMVITLAAMAGVFIVTYTAGMTALTAWERGKAIVDRQ